MFILSRSNTYLASMDLLKRGQRSCRFSQKTIKAKRNGNKSKPIPAPARTEKICKLKEVQNSSNSCNGLQWPWYILVVAAALGCYVKSFHGEFVHDDIFAIKQNADIRPSSPILDLFSHDYWGKSLDSSSSHKSFRPLCVLTFRAQFLLHGLNPSGFRLVNVLMHAVVCCLFVHICERHLGCSRLFSFLCGVLFAVHPVHAEPVNAVVGRADILACLLFLLAFKMYANCIASSRKRLLDENGNEIPTVSSWIRPHWKYFILFNILGAAAMFTKETGITVFGVCIMYDIMVVQQWHLVRSTKQISSKMNKMLLARILILTSVVSFLMYVRLLLQNGELPQFSAEENPASHSDSWLTRLLTYSYLCFFNASLLIAPVTLCYDWQMESIPLVESLLDIRNLATIIFFSILFCLFVMSSATSILNEPGEQKIILSGLLLLTIPFLPASNILFTVGFVVAERILYIPSLGYCLLINFGLAKLSGITICSTKDESLSWRTARCEVTAFLYALMLACFSWKTWQQSLVWQTRGTLFRSGVHTLPQNAKVQYNYANYLRDVGRNEEAIHHYQMAIKLAPDHSSSHNNLGTLLGNSEEAIKHFKLAIKFNPYHANALFNLGSILSIRDELNESEKYLRESFRLNPNSSRTLMLLTDVLTQKGLFNEADEVFKGRILEKPDDFSLFNNYGIFLAKNEKFHEALIYYDKANSLAPEYAIPVVNKANAFMAVGDYKAAEITLKSFLEQKKDASVYHQLATLYSKHLQRPSDAEKAWRETLRIDPTSTEAMFDYVLWLKSQGRKLEVFGILDRFLKFQSTSTEVTEKIAAFLHDMGYLKEALVAIENSLKISKTSSLYYQKGNILKDQGLLREAITAYKLAVNLDPKFTDAFINLGAVHHVLGNVNDAKFYYNYALTLDPSNKVAKTNLERLLRK